MVIINTIKLNFADFWPGFNPQDNYLTKLLRSRFPIEISDKPDFLIYSVFGKSYQTYRGIRIFYTGENRRPNFKDCDYAFSFDHLNHPNHYRLPLYAFYLDDPADLIKQNFDPHALLAQKTKFCNFIYSNQRAEKRVGFFHKLSEYKHIDSGGRCLNNIGGPVADKLEFIKPYKFTIAFENWSHPGYTTEKIIHPMLVHSLPIYWGNDLVGLDFNPKSFLNYHDYDSEAKFIERIIEVDQNDDLYLEYLKQPYYHNNQVNEFIKPENILKQFAYIFNTPKIPVALKKRSIFLLNGSFPGSF